MRLTPAREKPQTLLVAFETLCFRIVRGSFKSQSPAHATTKNRKETNKQTLSPICTTIEYLFKLHWVCFKQRKASDLPDLSRTAVGCHGFSHRAVARLAVNISL